MRSHLAPPPAAPVEPGPVPTFSVIIAAYQAADTVGEAVASALDQTVPPHEVIVCDDGSTDDIEGALAPYRERITFLRQGNRGEGAARNHATRVASGEFVVILDADDVYLPDRIEALGELAVIRPDLDILNTDGYLERDGRTVGRFYRDQARFVVDDQRMEILQRNFLLVHCAVRRSRLLSVGGFDEAISGGATDFNLWIRLILEGSRVGLVDEPLIRYRLRAGSLSDANAEHLRWTMIALERATRPVRDRLSPEERRVLDRKLALMSHDSALAGLEAALRSGAADARRRSLAVAVGRRFGAPTRLKALGSALAPRSAGRFLARRERGGGPSRVVRRMPPTSR